MKGKETRRCGRHRRAMDDTLNVFLRLFEFWIKIRILKN